MYRYSKISIEKIITLFCISVLVFINTFAGECSAGNATENDSDTLLQASDTDNMKMPYMVSFPTDSSSGLIHRIGVELHPGYIIQTHPFFRGENYFQKRLRNSLSMHFNYSFQFQPDTYSGRIYNDAYQGIGLNYNSFGDQEEVGNPVGLYLLQGARIARLSQNLSFNYEWNLGLSFGWKPYNYENNHYNVVIGSKINAYINANLYLKWMLSPQVDLISGVGFTHFSNGNTKLPNGGLNTIGLKLGLAYNFNRNERYLLKPLYQQSPVARFTPYISYDLVLFGSWRRKMVHFGDDLVVSPHKYNVVGFNFAAMYNIGYKFRTGISLDGVYDKSANVYTEDYISGTEQEFYKPSLDKQLALGLSGRAEYVMPYFTVGIGLGANVLHRGGDLKAFYQILALKMELTKSSFIHVGYSLHDFHTPNFLMLGIGFRFNNKYPYHYR